MLTHTLGSLQCHHLLSRLLPILLRFPMTCLRRRTFHSFCIWREVLNAVEVRVGTEGCTAQEALLVVAELRLCYGRPMSRLCAAGLEQRWRRYTLPYWTQVCVVPGDPGKWEERRRYGHQRLLGGCVVVSWVRRAPCRVPREVPLV